MADFTYTYEAATMPGFPDALTRSDGCWVPCDLLNREYQEFLSAIAGGMAAPEGWSGPQNPSEPQA